MARSVQHFYDINFILQTWLQKKQTESLQQVHNKLYNLLYNSAPNRNNEVQTSAAMTLFYYWTFVGVATVKKVHQSSSKSRQKT